MASDTTSSPGVGESDLTIEEAPHRIQSWRSLAPLLAMLDVVLVAGLAMVLGSLYYTFALGADGRLGEHLGLGLTLGIFFVLARTLRGDYAYHRYASARALPASIGTGWAIAFLGVAAALFLLKSGDQISRGTALLVCLAGPLALGLQQRLLAGYVRAAHARGRIAARRVFLVGRASDLAAFAGAGRPELGGLMVAGSARLEDGRSPPELEADLRHLVAAAREAAPDEILILNPWSDAALISRCVESCRAVPASISLTPDPALRAFPALEEAVTSGTANVELVRAPLTPGEQTVKRALDIVVAGAALVLLAPLLALVALAIKLDSPGPVLFRQRRHCFNRRTFSIFKFRSMSVMEDGAQFRQATRNDPRITRVGGFLRRTNLDELPQLLNVLIGDMSVVGPRPHPIALDAEYERRIDVYTRRHNVKPGITGWAQVNGYRGETDTEEKMRKRIEHDIHYLDHWSLWLDLRILFLTVLSRKAFQNAY